TWPREWCRTGKQTPPFACGRRPAGARSTRRGPGSRPRSTAAATSGRRGRRGFPDRPPARCAMQPSVGLPPPLPHANNLPPLAQGGVMAQMRRIFYCRITLAILLIGRHVATMSPQAAHRRAILAARCARLPARCDQDKGRTKSEAAAHGKLAANASAIGNAITNRNLVSINSHRSNGGGSVDAKPASSAMALMTGRERGGEYQAPQVG